MKVYLDNSATTKVYPDVARYMVKMMEEVYGNPSSLHSMGVEAERELKKARHVISRALGTDSRNIIFTSGGTESDNLAIMGSVGKLRKEKNHVITTKVEHPAVLETFKQLELRGYEVTYLDVDENCRVSLEQLEEALSRRSCLVSIMTVNNEVGTVQPINKFADIIRAKSDAIFHTDGVQAFSKMDMSSIKADLIAVSAHKIHGPKGVGALCSKNSKLKPIQYGGGQERNLRSGTENMPGIAGFAVAAEIAMNNFKDNADKVKSLNRYFRDMIEDNVKDIVINSPEDALPGVLNISFMGTRAEVILHSLEETGIMVSTGSACSSGKKGYSHVLSAMGMEAKRIEGAIRFSISHLNSREEMEYAAEKVKEAVERFRKLGSFR